MIKTLTPASEIQISGITHYAEDWWFVSGSDLACSQCVAANSGSIVESFVSGDEYERDTRGWAAKTAKAKVWVAVSCDLTLQLIVLCVLCFPPNSTPTLSSRILLKRAA